MNREKLSPAQWGALLWAAALAPASELLPGVALELAGRGAWLSPLAALIFLLPLFWLGRRGDVTALRKSWAGRAVLVLCVLWMELLVVLRLGLCARRMLWSGERDGAVWYFLLTLAAIALWIGQGKLSAFGRAGQLFLVMLMGAAVLVLGLSLPRLRADRVLPLWTQDAVPVLLSGVSAAGSIGWAVLPLLLLPVQERKGKTLVLWGVGGGVLLTLAQLIIIGNLGVGLCAQSDSAFFALTKSVGVEGAFQRVESIVAAVWVFSDLLLLTGILWCIRRIGGVLCPRVPAPTLVTIAALSAMVTALALFGERVSPRALERILLPLGSLVLGLTIPGLAILMRGRKRER